MILWLASYPKSGNTWIRSLLSAYLFSSDGNFNFKLLNNIKQFSSEQGMLNNNLSSQEKIYKNWIPAQEKINQNNEIHILKTHNALCNINGYNFTNKFNTIGVVYIVRDPRNLIISISNHYNLSQEEAYDFIINKKKIIFPKILKESNDYNKNDFNFLSDWSGHYKSWKDINFCPIKVIKYEDIIKNDHEVFMSTLKFTSKFFKINIDEKKINNVLSSTSFEKLREMENKHGFEESVVSSHNNKKNKFFNLGKNNNWKKLLDNKIRKKVEKIFEKEMIELEYL
tara:strand:+ start:372 stop:1220 length:849 start_codon:yes stop_codon:yes gene_type:complete